MYSAETSIYGALLTGLVLFTGLVAFFIFSIVRYQRRRVQAYHELMEEEISLLEIERTRIANDLHDEIGVMLSALKLLLSGIKPAGAADRTVMAKVMGHLDEIVEKIRQLSYNMMPRILETKGLAAAIADLLDIVSFSSNIRVDSRCTMPAGTLTVQKKIHVFRMVQEIVNNILKHANASFILCELLLEENTLVLHLYDNGTGFDKKKVAKTKQGAGLLNIMARVNLLGARLYLTTEESKGTDYLIKIPL